MQLLVWTAHAKMKMRYYGLSESRVKRVLRSPERIEEGIAEGTVAMMQLGSTTAKNPYEIWVMTSKLGEKKGKKSEFEKLKDSLSKNKKTSIRVISAWKYPGRTRPGEPLPSVILRELREAI